VREIRTLRAMWRALETGLRQFLNGHEEGNLGYKPRRSLRAAAPVLDPTGVMSVESFNHGTRQLLLRMLWLSVQVQLHMFWALASSRSQLSPLADLCKLNAIVMLG
jgi:hypothetical protein